MNPCAPTGTTFVPAWPFGQVFNRAVETRLRTILSTPLSGHLPRVRVEISLSSKATLSKSSISSATCSGQVEHRLAPAEVKEVVNSAHHQLVAGAFDHA